MSWEEGFNLQREGLLRIASALSKLNPTQEEFIQIKRRNPGECGRACAASGVDVSRDVSVVLVLPPWCSLAHWEEQARSLRWSDFFEPHNLEQYLQSLGSPVIEFDVWREIIGVGDGKAVPIHTLIDLVSSYDCAPDALENSATGTTLFKMKCGDLAMERGNEVYNGCHKFTNQKHQCVCALASGEDLGSAFWRLVDVKAGDSIMVRRADILTQGNSYFDWSEGPYSFWTWRRSLLPNAMLIKAATELMRQRGLTASFARNGPASGAALRRHEKPYISAHYRRGDFGHMHPEDIPTAQTAAKEIATLADQVRKDQNMEGLSGEGLKAVFVATDATEEEVAILRQELSRKGLRLVVYDDWKGASGKDWKGLTSGQRALVEQVVAASAAAFIGTRSSTFSGAIMEHRDLWGSPRKWTSSVFCGSDDPEYGQPGGEGGEADGFGEMRGRSREGLCSAPVFANPPDDFIPHVEV